MMDYGLTDSIFPATKVAGNTFADFCMLLSLCFKPLRVRIKEWLITIQGNSPYK